MSRIKFQGYQVLVSFKKEPRSTCRKRKDTRHEHAERIHGTLRGEAEGKVVKEDRHSSGNGSMFAQELIKTARYVSYLTLPYLTLQLQVRVPYPIK